MPKQIAIWGHRSVHHLKSLMSDGVFPSNLGLDYGDFIVHLEGEKDLSLNHTLCLHSRDNLLAGKDLVLLDIGTNDIVYANISVNQFALNLASYAAYLIIGLNVKKWQ